MKFKKLDFKNPVLNNKELTKKVNDIIKNVPSRTFRIRNY